MASTKSRAARGTKLKVTSRPDPEDALRSLELEGSFVPGLVRGRAGLAGGASKFVVSYFDPGGEMLEQKSFKSAQAAERAAILFSEDHAGEGLYAIAEPRSLKSSVRGGAEGCVGRGCASGQTASSRSVRAARGVSKRSR